MSGNSTAKFRAAMSNPQIRLENRPTGDTPGWLSSPSSIVAAILVSAFLVRLIGIEHRWLWSDELLSANFIAHGFWNTLITNLRFDIHPPLYYLQLELWALFSRSDLWLMLNSVLWSVVAVGILIAAVRRFFGLRSALIAGALFAFSPAALAYGDQVRMYSFLMALIIWVWVAQMNWLRAAPDRQRLVSPPSLNLILSQLAVIYTHSAGLIMISGCVTLAATMLAEGRDIRAAKRWIICQCVVGLSALPAVAIALVREAGHVTAPSLAEIWTTWEFLAAGAMQFTLLGPILGIGLLAVLIYVMVTMPGERIGVANLIFVPLIIAAAISYGLKPTWIERIFVTIIPFLCLFAALAIEKQFDLTSSTPRIRRILAVGLALIWVGTGVAGQLTREKGDGFKLAASYLHQNIASGDVVLVDGDYPYWCLLWYFAGPDWGVPQQAYIETPKWRGFAAKLNPVVLKALDFRAQKREINVKGTDVIMWDRENPVQIPSARNVFLVRNANTGPVTLEGYNSIGSRRDEDLVIDEFAKSKTN